VERSPAADDASSADTFTDLLGRRAGTLIFGITSAALIIAYARIRRRRQHAAARAGRQGQSLDSTAPQVDSVPKLV
jgi:hypothetical protein